MKRHMRILSLIMIAVWMLNGVAFAGALGSTSVKLPTEYINGNGANTAGVNVDTVLTAANFYNPNGFALGVATSAVVSLQIAKGKFGGTLPATNLVVCPSPGGANTIVASYLSGAGTNDLAFATGGNSMSNGVNYMIGSNATGGTNCAALAAGAVNIQGIASGTTSDAINVTTGSAILETPYDTATGNILTSAQLISASVTQAAGVTDSIDYATNFTTLFNGTSDTNTSSNINFTVAVGSGFLASTNQTSATDNLTLVLTASDVSAIVGGNFIFNGGAQTQCTFNATNKTLSCPTLTGAILAEGANYVDVVNITVVGGATNIINPKTFTVSANYTFGADAANMQADNGILSNTAAGAWVDRGTSAYVPLIRSTNGIETYIKLQSSDSVNDTVKAQVLCGNGTVTTVTLPTLVPGTPLLVTGANIIALLPATCTVNGSNGFAAVLNITAGQAVLFGVIDVIDSIGHKFVPLSMGTGL